jgi:hypothetical protein
LVGIQMEQEIDKPARGFDHFIVGAHPFFKEPPRGFSRWYKYIAWHANNGAYFEAEPVPFASMFNGRSVVWPVVIPSNCNKVVQSGGGL